MRMSEALRIIDGIVGFRVVFERKERGLLVTDYFPAIDEPAIMDEERAWKLAARFAERTRGSCVNVFVGQVSDGKPVAGYEKRILSRHPE